MSFTRYLGVSALFLARGALSQCASGRVFDDFTTWTDNTNLFSYWVSDDETMSAIDVDQNTLWFTTAEDSYFYETLPCQQAIDSGYYGFSFDIQGPAGSTFALELQTMESCAVNEYSSHYVTIEGITGDMQNVVIPWGDFEGEPNPNAIVGIIWFDFASEEEWGIKNIKFLCGTAVEGTDNPVDDDPVPIDSPEPEPEEPEESEESEEESEEEEEGEEEEEEEPEEPMPEEPEDEEED